MINSKMIEVDVHVPRGSNPASIPHLVEEACAAEGLTLTLKGTLAKYPHCVHWHYKKGNERGTLEITWWEKENRLWFKVAAGRTGAWMEETMARLKNRLENIQILLQGFLDSTG
jgi:hypothetical protein